MMTLAVDRTEQRFAAAEQAKCPFEDSTCNTCAASFSGFAVGVERRSTFCATDNYDACPFFLSRVIRKKY